jgi:DNA-binding NtrC family response regulator
MTVKALIFDDDNLALNLLQSFLSVNNVSVSAHPCATCPMYQQDASVCPLVKPEFNIIISDNNMPDKMGIEFFEEIDTKDCKIPNNCKLLLTGELTPQIRDRAEKIGITALEKPCSFEVLGKWIDGAVNHYANS